MQPVVGYLPSFHAPVDVILSVLYIICVCFINASYSLQSPTSYLTTLCSQFGKQFMKLMYRLVVRECLDRPWTERWTQREPG